MVKTPGQYFYKDVAFCRRPWYAVCGATNNGRRLALSRRGQLLLPPDTVKGGLPNGYLFRSYSAWHFDRWYYRPVHAGKKEVIAGTLDKYGDHDIHL